MTLLESSRSLDDFYIVSSRLCGFDLLELKTTGIGQELYEALRRETGSDLLQEFIKVGLDAEEAEISDIIKHEKYGPLTHALIHMWYLGTWTRPDDSWCAKYIPASSSESYVISARTYRESLVWRALGAHPGSAKPGGFGSWASQPE